MDAQKGIRIVCISDTHSKHSNMENLPPGDILVHAGDFSNVGTLKEVTDFVNWFDSQPYRYKIFISGNHDISMDTEYYVDRGAERFHMSQKEMTPLAYSEACRDLLKQTGSNTIYLEDSEFVIPLSTFTTESNITEGTKSCSYTDIDHHPPPLGAGVKCYGSPWQPEFCDWAFNVDRGDAIRAKWDKIPESVDVLITHGPPYGFGDTLVPSGDSCGCVDLLHNIKERGSACTPRLHIFGHIHEAPGTWFDGTTLFVNASTCTYFYKPTNKPIVVHLPFDNTLPAFHVKNGEGDIKCEEWRR